MNLFGSFGCTSMPKTKDCEDAAVVPVHDAPPKEHKEPHKSKKTKNKKATGLMKLFGL